MWVYKKRRPIVTLVTLVSFKFQYVIMNSFPVRNGPSLKKVRVLFISRKFVVIALVLSKKTFKYGKCILTSFAITFISLWKWILPFIEQTKNSLHLRPGPTAQPLADEKGIQNVKKKAPPPPVEKSPLCTPRPLPTKPPYTVILSP